MKYNSVVFKLVNVLLMSVLIMGCGRKEKFMVEGKITDAPEKTKIYFNSLKVSKSVPIDSAILGKSKTFKFRSKTKVPDFYQLSLERKKFITLIVKPGDKIRVETSYENFHVDYEVDGSRESQLIKDLNLQVSQTREKVDSLNSVFNSIQNDPGNTPKIDAINQEYMKILNEQRKASIGFVIKNYNSLASIVALYQEIKPGSYIFYSPKDMQYFKIVSDSLSVKYPNTPHVKSLVVDFKSRMEEMKHSTMRKMFANARESIPDLEIPDISGDTVRLLDLTDRYILLSFTSSSCFECRLDNLDLKEVYNKFHRKGFEIYQVSLDTLEASWINSVHKDNLPWISVSEMEINNSHAARVYNIRQIPANYLIGPDRDILGKNLFGKKLEKKLQEVL
ncbi:MAG: redoxin domain-containing protein [Bacteroidota bacterium]